MSVRDILGVYLIIVGLVMIIFHKQVKQWFDDLFPPHIPIWPRPTGALLTGMIVVFGALSILIGVTLVLLAFDPQ